MPVRQIEHLDKLLLLDYINAKVAYEIARHVYDYHDADEDSCQAEHDALQVAEAAWRKTFTFDVLVSDGWPPS